MKKIIFILFTVLSIELYSNNIVVYTDPEKRGGFLEEITKSAYSAVGYNIQIEYLPWARALEKVKNSNSDVLLGAQYTFERSKYLKYSDKIAESEMVFFKRKSLKIKYSTLEDLEGYTIGTIIKSIYTEEFDKAKYLKKEPVSNYITNIDKLISGRIDLFLEKKNVVLKELEINYIEEKNKIDYLEKPLKKLEFYNCFSNKDPNYIKKLNDFNKGLSIIKKNGTYTKIMSKNLHE